MSWSRWNRQIHRWVSIIFTFLSGSIFVALGVGLKPAQWIFYVPLAPLALLVITGSVMFFQPFFRPRGAATKTST